MECQGRALHALRHHAERTIYGAAGDIKKVALCLGHATTATTERYIDLAAGPRRRSTGAAEAPTLF